jgi:hypothetical protein
MTTVMQEFDILEISAVDRPAQKGARAVIMKRDDLEKGGGSRRKGGGNPRDEEKGGGSKKPRKGGGRRRDEEEDKKNKRRDDPNYQGTRKRSLAVMTTSDNGHAHLVWIGDQAGETSFGTSADEESFGHTHPYIVNADGTITIGENDGHTHDVDQAEVLRLAQRAIGELQRDEDFLGKSEDEDADGNPDGGVEKKETEMSGDTDKAAQELEAATKKNDELSAQLEKANALAELTDVQKAHYNGLDDDGKEAFLAKSEDQRQSEIDNLAKADPVIYTDSLGQEYRKSDDPRMVENAKRADKAEKNQAKALEKAADVDLRKRAEALEHIPGTVETRMAMLKSIDAIENETVRADALQSINAQNEAMAHAFKNYGTTGGAMDPAPNSPEAELDALVKAEMQKSDVSEAVAYDTVLKSAEGQAAYAKMKQV